MVHPARTCLASPPTPLSLESQENGSPDGGLDLSNLSPGPLEMSGGGLGSQSSWEIRGSQSQQVDERLCRRKEDPPHQAPTSGSDPKNFPGRDWVIHPRTSGLGKQLQCSCDHVSSPTVEPCVRGQLEGATAAHKPSLGLAAGLCGPGCSL